MNPRLAAGAIVIGASALAYSLFKSQKKEPSVQENKPKPIPYDDMPAFELLTPEEEAKAKEETQKEIDEMFKNDKTQLRNRELCNEFTVKVAEYLKVKPEEIARSERFESAVLTFVKKLEPEYLNFLDAKPDASGQSKYDANEKNIKFLFKQYNVDQIWKIAQVLENHFKEINTVIQQNTRIDGLYWINCNREKFLNEVLPHVFNEKPLPRPCWFPAEPTMLTEPYLTRYIMYKPMEKKPVENNIETVEATTTQVSSPRPK